MDTIIKYTYEEKKHFLKKNIDNKKHLKCFGFVNYEHWEKVKQAKKRDK
tara:strand:- start:1965 stop:2111 length:147 start_codon:yes stop_codon:yes gene_type:complete